MRSHRVATPRLELALVESGPEDGIPIVLIGGNLSTGRFFEHLFGDAPARYRLLAPDMRGFGDTERVAIDATRGLRDWADDTFGLPATLGITAPPHLVGWSTGGAAIAAFALEHPVASLTFIDPVSPYGYGATALDGTPHFADFAGSGAAGTASSGSTPSRRSCGRTAPATSSSPTARRGSSGPAGSSGSFPAGREPTRSDRSRWWRRSVPCWRRTPGRVAGCGPTASRARATVRRSTRASAGVLCSSSSWSP
jgi:pimeloyl-ACP methyl ester carboxylesterase